MARKKMENRETTLGDAVESAFSDASELKDELETWHGNLPEAFQNGEKGEALQTAIDAIDGAQQPDVPSDFEGESISYSEVAKRASRRDRLDSCIARLQAVADCAREKAGDLGEFKYNDEGERDADDAEQNPDAPSTEEERDQLVTDLEALADECESAVSDWEGVEFPGMYG